MDEEEINNSYSMRYDTSQIYYIESEKKEPGDAYANLIFQKTSILPTQCYLVNDNQSLYVKYPIGVNPGTWHTPKTLKDLKTIGLIPKLTQRQQELNTIFINSAPSIIFDHTQESLIDHINESNKNIRAMNVFVPKQKSSSQKLGSIKITLMTRNMVNSIMTYGMRIGGCLMEPGSVRQGYYPKIPQCTFCQKFHKGKCPATHPTCPNCAQSHRRFECRTRDRLKCGNCLEHHKASSNFCIIRNRQLTAEPIQDFKLEDLVCPFGEICSQYKPQTQSMENPQPNSVYLNSTTSGNLKHSWADITTNKHLNTNSITNPVPSTGIFNMMNPTVTSAPLTTYSDCLRMALMGSNWYDSYLSLQTTFGLPRVELPLNVRRNMRNTETYKGPEVASPPVNNDSSPADNRFQRQEIPGKNEWQTQRSFKAPLYSKKETQTKPTQSRENKSQLLEL